MIIECSLDNGILILKDGYNTGIAIREDVLRRSEVKVDDTSKTRVKQALKLKEAGFTGKEIIDIIGEIE